MKLLIVRIGEVERETTDQISDAVGKRFAFEITTGDSIPVFPRTFNTRRKQYNSTRILQALESEIPHRDELILGIIDQDLYVPELNFVFGQADMLARIAVIALPRLRQEFYGLEPDRELFLLRATKEAIHELGHVVGLEHCPDPRCVMHFSNSLSDTDLKKSDFCTDCRKELDLLKINEGGTIR